MLFTSVSLLAAAMALPRLALSQTAHGEGAEGTVMGPVAFLWPDDRVWDANSDNTAPCGSASGPVNRTIFPLSHGSIELTIADEAWNVEVSIAFNNDDPKSQSDFQQVVGNVSEVYPGHQCYSIPDAPSNVPSGSNATIQLAYWANDSNQNQSFYACADIQYVDITAFTTKITCFNVTASEFITPAATSSAAGTSATGAATSAAAAAPAATSAATVTESSSSGLSAGAKAGISVGTIVGGLAVIGLLAWFVVRRRGAAKKRDAEAAAAAASYPPVKEVRYPASLQSGETATARE